jgi:hypothetical protein
MSDKSSRRLPVSPFRKNIVELMRLSKKLPLVTAERRMNLSAIIEARKAGPIKPSWTAIFSKAFALVAGRRPELRTAYMSYPYPHLYVHPYSIATVIVEREYQGELFPLNCRLRNPSGSTLLELHRTMEQLQTIPLEEDKQFRFMYSLGCKPLLLRRSIWWMGYHWSGCKRAHYFGTFALSSPAIGGAGLTTIVSPLSCSLHYGLFDEAGQIDMRLTFDHRAVDGAPVARALAEMEQVLMTEMLDEIKQLPSTILGTSEAIPVSARFQLPSPAPVAKILHTDRLP